MHYLRIHFEGFEKSIETYVVNPGIYNRGHHTKAQLIISQIERSAMTYIRGS